MLELMRELDNNITLANVTGLKKCIKAIIAKVMEITFAETNDPL